MHLHEVSPIDENPPCSSLPWFAVRTKSNAEKTVANLLRGKGYEEFLPTYRAMKVWSDRIKEMQMPLFRGYVFCRMDPQKRLPVLTTPGVVDIVGFGKAPAPISDAEIGAIQTIIQSGVAAGPWPFLAVGDHVLINKGPMKGIEGFLLKLKDRYRVVISIPLLGRSVSVEIDGAYVERLNSEQVPAVQAIGRLEYASN